MWKSRKEDERPKAPAATPQPAVAAPAVIPTKPAVYTPAVHTKEVVPMETPKSENFRADVAHIGKSVVVKGELSGSEDLYLDGEVEGSIELRGHGLTIGPHGRVKANVQARDVVVHGKVEGNVRGTDRVELKKSAILIGDIFTQRIVIEEGAFFKGGIDIQKDAAPKPDTKPEPKREAMAASASGSHSGASSTSNAAPSSTASPASPVAQSTLLDKKY